MTEIQECTQEEQIIKLRSDTHRALQHPAGETVVIFYYQDKLNPQREKDETARKTEVWFENATVRIPLSQLIVRYRDGVYVNQPLYFRYVATFFEEVHRFFQGNIPHSLLPFVDPRSYINAIAHETQHLTQLLEKHFDIVRHGSIALTFVSTPDGPSLNGALEVEIGAIRRRDLESMILGAINPTVLTQGDIMTAIDAIRSIVFRPWVRFSLERRVKQILKRKISLHQYLATL